MDDIINMVNELSEDASSKLDEYTKRITIVLLKASAEIMKEKHRYETESRQQVINESEKFMAEVINEAKQRAEQVISDAIIKVSEPIEVVEEADIVISQAKTSARQSIDKNGGNTFKKSKGKALSRLDTLELMFISNKDAIADDMEED